VLRTFSEGELLARLPFMNIAGSGHDGGWGMKGVETKRSAEGAESLCCGLSNGQRWARPRARPMD